MPCRLSLAAVAAIAGSILYVHDAAAQIERVDTFCELNLEENGLGGFVQASEAPEGSVYTNATKFCVPTNPLELIVLECNTKLDTWTAETTQLRFGVLCEIDGEACGRPQKFTTRFSSLSVRPNGDATLRCAVLR